MQTCLECRTSIHLSHLHIYFVNVEFSSSRQREKQSDYEVSDH